MRFLVDESTGAAVVGYLRSAGYDVLAVDGSGQGTSPQPIYGEIAAAVPGKR